jgi:hypothetical protein
LFDQRYEDPCREEDAVDEFLISNAAGTGGLLFFDRSPFDPAEPIGSFWVRITGHNVSASGSVYAGYAPSHPALLFADMARQWSGWTGDLKWESLEGELILRCSHDGLGHISIRTELCSGHMPEDWRVAATVTTEAGQLAGIAHRAAMFFGRAA